MPLNIEPRKLARAGNAGYQRFAPFRAASKYMLEQYVGRWYARSKDEADTQAKTIVNLINQAVQVYLFNLVNPTLKHKALSRRVELHGEAFTLGLAMDWLSREIDLAETQEDAILSALLGPCAIVKVGLRAGGEMVKIDDKLTDAGQPYCTEVDYDDYGLDADCRKRDEAKIEFHRYRISREAAVSSGIFNREALDNVPSLSKMQGSDGSTAAEMTSGEIDRFELDDTIELWDFAVYGADSTYICTLASQQAGSDTHVISEEAGFVIDPYEFEGPERGPYEILSFNRVRANPMGLPPVSSIADLHGAVAKIANKAVRQMLRTKRVGTFKRGSADAAMTIQEAPDGEMVEVDDPQAVVMQDFGGVIPELYQGIQWMMGAFNNASGNVQQMSGNTQSGGKDQTATESSLLASASSLRIRYMQQRCQVFRQRVASQLAWYMINDPIINKPIPYRPPGGEWLQVHYDAATRQGGAGDFNFEIEPYSPPPMEPSVRAARIVQLFQALPTFLPLIQAGVTTIDKVLTVLGREMGIEGLDELIASPGVIQMAMQAAGGVPLQPGIIGAGMGGQPQNGKPKSGPSANGSMSGRPVDQVRSAMAPGTPNGY